MGFISGTGANGCTAASDNNEGSCVYYGRESTNKGPLKPDWLEPLNQAAAALYETEQAAQRAHALADRITALNNTLSSIIHLGAAAASQQKSKANHPTDKTVNSKNAEEVANRECKQHKNNKSACENAGKFKFKGKTKTDGPCEPKEREVQTNETGTGDEAAGITKEGKKWSATTKFEGDKGCKWDGKE